jgi:uncharacterized protein (DUF1778 family)
MLGLPQDSGPFVNEEELLALHVRLIAVYSIRRCIMRSTTTSTARLEARISKELHATLKRAAELQNRTMTDFVITAVQEAAQNAIEQTEVLRLSLADQKHFFKALQSPPKATPALERAFARHRKLVSAE